MKFSVQGAIFHDWQAGALVGLVIVLLIVGGWILKASDRKSQHLRRKQGSRSRSSK